MLWDQLSNPFLKIVKLCFLSVIVNRDNEYAGNSLTPWCKLFSTPHAPPFPHFSHIHESQLSQPFTFYYQKGRVSQCNVLARELSSKQDVQLLGSAMAAVSAISYFDENCDVSKLSKI